LVVLFPETVFFAVRFARVDFGGDWAADARDFALREAFELALRFFFARQTDTRAGRES
jgi:hypothetical protein